MSRELTPDEIRYDRELLWKALGESQEREARLQAELKAYRRGASPLESENARLQAELEQAIAQLEKCRKAQNTYIARLEAKLVQEQQAHARDLEKLAQARKEAWALRVES